MVKKSSGVGGSIWVHVMLKLLSFSGYEEYDAANKRRCACDGRQRYVVGLFASSMNRSNINDLFPGRVRKTSPRKSDQTKRNQDYSKRFVHGGLLRQR